MAVQLQYAAHGAIRPDTHKAASFLLGEPGGGPLAVQQQVPHGGNTVLSDLTGNNDGGCFLPRMGDVVGAAGLSMEGQRALLPPPPLPMPFAADPQSRVLCSGAAPVSHGLLSHLYRHSVETDALIRVENERLRAGLQEARRRHVRAAVSALETAAARRLRDAEAELGRSLCRHAELEQKVQQMVAEAQAWQGVAKSHEAAASGLRATLDQLLRSQPCAGVEGEGETEAAQSCCFERDRGADVDDRARRRACKACGEAEACVLLLPCRHLCLCAGCEAAAEACPVCAATKNATLHVLLS